MSAELIQDELPKDLCDLESERAIYPRSMQVVYGDLRKQDAPRAEMLGDPKNIKADRPARIRITFRSEKGVLFTVGAFRPTTLDYAEEGEIVESPKVGVPVKLHWILHSQLQGFVLHVDRSQAGDKSSKATVHFHVNNILASEDGNEKKLWIQHQQGALLAPRIDPNSDLNPNVEGGYEGGNTYTLWGIDVTPWRNGDREDVFADDNAEPRFCGVSSEELEDIRRKGEEALKNDQLGDPSILTHGDWILWGLLICRDFTMYRTWSASPEASKVFKYFTRYTDAVFADILAHGNWPHYARIAREHGEVDGENLLDNTFSIGETFPPQHIVKKWRVGYDAANEPVEAVAETWDSFPPLAAYPDGRSKSVALMLGAERGIDYASFDVQERLDTENGSLQGLFFKLGHAGAYYLEVRLADSTRKLLGNSVAAPVPKTRVQIKVDSEGDFNGWVFYGVVTEDAYLTGCDFAAILMAKRPQYEFPEAVTKVVISVQLNDNILPIARQVVSIKELAKGGKSGQKGVDLRALFLEYPVSLEHTSSLADEVSNIPEAKAVMDSVLHSWGANDSEKEAGNLGLNSQSGVVAAWGSIEIGTTRIAMSVAEAHVRIGKLLGIKRRPVLCVGPSNAVTDNMLQVILDKLKRSPTGVDLQLVRFRSSDLPMYISRTDHENAAIKQAVRAMRIGETDGTGLSLADSTIWATINAQSKDKGRHAVGDEWQYEWNRARKAFIIKHSNDDESLWQSEAKSYIYTKAIVAKATARDEKEELERDLDGWDHVWSQRFADQIDIVFVTNNSAAHEVIARHYKPKILVADGVAQTTIVDQATPAAAFKHTLEQVFFAGDPTQKAPKAQARHANETYPEVSKSIFETLLGDKCFKEKVELVKQPPGHRGRRGKGRKKRAQLNGEDQMA